MNREMRRLQEAEERRRKKAEETGPSRAQRRAAAMQSRALAGGERKSFPRRIAEYLHEVRVEMRKVTWPTREQMMAFTTVTLVTTIVLTGVVFGLDVLAKQAVIWLIERGT